MFFGKKNKAELSGEFTDKAVDNSVYNTGLPVDNLGLVEVNLPSLVRLAQAAKSVNLHHDRIRALQSGTYLSPYKGRGMEFDEVRLYQPGDDIRSIDWKVTARTGKPHTKIFREERERPVFISVDRRRTMHFATRGLFKSVQAARLSALIAWAAQHHGDRIGGQIFAEDYCQEIKPQNGRHGVLRFLNALVKPSCAFKQVFAFERVLARLQHHARPGSLIYLISDFRGLSESTEAYMAKLSRHCELVLIFIYDPLEMALPEQGRYRFTDGEKDVTIDSGDRQKLLSYQQRFNRHREHLQVLAKKLGLLLIECRTIDDAKECLG